MDEAAAVMEGTVISGDAMAHWSGASIDSRATRPGHLFFALPGERTDGHRFVAAAVEAGAVGAVVSGEVEGVAEETGLIQVRDTTEALHALTRHVRTTVPEHLIAITGSAGKTTTKELLAAMLGTRFRVARSPGNLNNLLGFPLALLGIPEDTEWMVAEMGMSEPGELGRISRLGLPDVAVFTNIRAAHLEFFGSLRAVADAKAELLEGLVPGGLVIANRDDPEVRRIGEHYDGPVTWYGSADGSDVTARNVRVSPDRPGCRFDLEHRGTSREILLPLHGVYNVDNCLAAAACALSLGLSLEEVAAGTASVQPADMRGVVHVLEAGVTVIDDSYNSNPFALSRALESAAALPAVRRWAVLGEMLELGPGAPEMHRDAGREAAKAGFAFVVGVGEAARDLAAGAAESGARTAWVKDAAAAAEIAVPAMTAGDLVLVKGSRGVGLERVVRALLEAGEKV